MCKKQLRLDLKSPNMKINTKRALLSNSILYDSCALSYQPIFKNRSPCRHSVVILVDQANPVILKHQCCIPRSVIGSYFGLIITLIIFFLSSKSRWQNKTSLIEIFQSTSYRQYLVVIYLAFIANIQHETWEKNVLQVNCYT